MKKKIQDIFKIISKRVVSMKVAIAIMLVLASVIPIGIARETCVRLYTNKVVNGLETALSNRCMRLAAQIGSSNYLVDQHDPIVSAAIDQLTYNYSGRVIVVATNYVVVKDTYIDRENKTLISGRVNRAFRGISEVKYDSAGGNVEVCVPITAGDGKGIVGVLIATAPDTEIRDYSSYIDSIFEKVMRMILPLMLIISIVITWGISRPLRGLTLAIRGITSGYMDKRLDEDKGFGEVREVSEEVNKMLDRLKVLDESRQEFVSNVSHELKTPITSIKVLAESLNGQDNIPVELYKEFMQDIVEEIDRENQIINDLLTLVRMDKTAAEINISTCNINELVEYVLKRLKPLAAEKNIEVVLENFRPVVAEVDEVKMNLVITNLVENAIKYNVANGWVRVSVNADHKYFYITVADSGIGIPEDDREKIFERFYRVDKARSRQTGGTGLGLAITKNVILMHKGEIRAYSQEGEGSTFTVRIPLMHGKQ